MKRLILMLALGLAVVVGLAVADAPYINNAVSVTATSQTLTVHVSGVPKTTVILLNSGPNSVYYCLWSEGTTPAACTTATGFELRSTESIVETHGRSEPGSGYIAVSVICAAAETAALRVKAK